jgi:hypothetical protein
LVESHEKLFEVCELLNCTWKLSHVSATAAAVGSLTPLALYCCTL